MSATITDYFNKASNMNGSYPPVAEVASARAVGGSVLTCDDLSGWATATPVHFSTFTLASDGTVDTSTQTDWKGIVVGNTITEMTRLAGAADSGNASGDKVELNPTIGWLDDLITGILVSHKQNGGLKDSVVTEDTIATGAVTSSKVAAGAISSYDKISDGVIQARNINWGTFAPGALITDYGDISSNTTLTPSADGFLVGKTVLFRTQAAASGSGYISDEYGTTLGGIPYGEVARGVYDGNFQVSWVIPVMKGKNYSAIVSGNGQLQSVQLRAARS